MKRNTCSSKEPLRWETAPDILTVREAAILVRIFRSACYEPIRLGLLPAHNFGQRRIRIAKTMLRQVFALGPQDKLRHAAFSRDSGGN
jgi:excisionase family DNA binding protein